MLSFVIILLYIILLIPHIIASNSGEAGIVIENQKINASSLPDDIQDILINKKDSYDIILIEDVFPKEKKQIAQEWNQITKERKLIISEGNQEKNSFVKLDDIKINIYIAYNIIPSINQSFEKLIIGDVEEAKFGGIIEMISYYNLTPILTLSKIDFYAGGLLVVLILTVLLYMRVALWNIPAIIACYSFQSFLANLTAGMNNFKIDTLSQLFGFLFILALPLTYKLKAFEETKEGKQGIYELYKLNLKIIKEILLKFKNMFGF